MEHQYVPNTTLIVTITDLVYLASGFSATLVGDQTILVETDCAQ